MRMRKKPNLAPRMERCAAMLIPDPASMRGHWKDEMPEAREIRLEIGCGKGRFTVETAAAEPDVLFVAIERVADAMVIAMERANEMGLANVRFIDADGNVFDYTVAWEETVFPSDRQQMVTGDAWHLTLFTCTYNGEKRFTLRCVLADQKK